MTRWLVLGGMLAAIVVGGCSGKTIDDPTAGEAAESSADASATGWGDPSADASTGDDASTGPGCGCHPPPPPCDDAGVYADASPEDGGEYADASPDDGGVYGDDASTGDDASVDAGHHPRRDASAP